jgi:hypothetical protein
MMEAVSTSETTINFYETARRNIPEDSPSVGVFADIRASNKVRDILQEMSITRRL